MNKHFGQCFTPFKFISTSDQLFIPLKVNMICIRETTIFIALRWFGSHRIRAAAARAYRPLQFHDRVGPARTPVPDSVCRASTTHRVTGCTSP